MLKDLFILAVGSAKQVLDVILPSPSYYIIAVFMASTSYLLFTAIRSGIKAFSHVPVKYWAVNTAFFASLFLLMCFGHRSFIIFTDERMYLQQAVEYTRTGQINFLLAESIMPFIFGLTLKLGNLTLLKTVVFLLLSAHFLLWKLILEDVLKAGAVVSSLVVFSCAVFCMYCFPDIITYMSFGYALSSLAIYLALKHAPGLDGDKVYYLLPFTALLAVTFRQECVVLFPFILIFLWLDGAAKKRILPLLLAFILALPVVYSLWRDELGMNAEPFDRKLVSECYASGRPVGECHSPGLSANRSYMLNTLSLLSRLHVPGDRIIDLAEETYRAPNPSLKNAYYNLRYRELWLGIITGAAFISMVLGIIFLKFRRRPLVLLASITGLYFSIFYLQKYSVGEFERFYFYLFPLYFCFITVLLRVAINKYLSRPPGSGDAYLKGS